MVEIEWEEILIPILVLIYSERLVSISWIKVPAG